MPLMKFGVGGREVRKYVSGLKLYSLCGLHFLYEEFQQSRKT